MLVIPVGKRGVEANMNNTEHKNTAHQPTIAVAVAVVAVDEEQQQQQ